jgi:hypothetical protein
MSLPKVKHAFIELEVPSTKAKIKIRQMLAREEKILLMAKAAPDTTEEQKAAKEIDIQNAVRQIINNCIVTQNVDVEKFALFDLQFLFLRLRGFSTTNIVKVGYIDNEDNKDYNFEFDLNKLEVKWPDKLIEKIKIDDTVTLHLKWPDASLYTNDGLLKAQSGNEAAEYLIVNCIDHITDGDTVIEASLDELKEFLNELPVDAYSKLYDHVFNMPRVIHEFNYKNESGKDRKIVLSSLSDFFTFL